MTAARFDVHRLGETFFAEISGLDVSKPQSDATIDAVKEAFHDHSILLFRGQNLTEQQQIAFTRRFGVLYDHVMGQFAHPVYPDVLVVSNIIENGKQIGLADAGRLWHSDLSYRSPGSWGAMLYAREVPEEGGDTLFADTIAAYEALPGDLAERIKGRTAVHSYLNSHRRLKQEYAVRPELTAAQLEQLHDVQHPLSFRHPGNGRTGLYVSEGFAVGIADLPEDQGQKLLADLNAHVTQDRFIYRHKWQAGDLLFWDNRSTLHKATGGYAWPQRRLMHRTTLKGHPLQAA